LLFLYFSSWQKEGGGYNRALKMGIKKVHLCCSYRRLSQPASQPASSRNCWAKGRKGAEKMV
jgi:hypothetical protein